MNPHEHGASLNMCPPPKPIRRLHCQRLQDQAQNGSCNEKVQLEQVTFDYRAPQQSTEADFTITTPLIAALAMSNEIGAEAPPPKPARSAYKFFIELERPRLVNELIESGSKQDVDIPFELAERWSALEGWEKDLFRQLAYIDEQRYSEECREWRAKRRAQVSLDEVEPLRLKEDKQWPFWPEKKGAMLSPSSSELDMYTPSQKLPPTVKHMLTQREAPGSSRRRNDFSPENLPDERLCGFWDQRGVFQRLSFTG